MKPVRTASLALATTLAMLAGQSPADAAETQPKEDTFFVNLGYGIASYRTTGRADILGTPVPDAAVALESLGFVALELGVRLSPDWSVTVLGGLPPTVTLRGRGAFAPQGILRKVKYGTVMAGGRYHPLHLGRFEPYVGAGVSYTTIFKTHSGSMLALDVKDNVGPYLQAGARVRIADHVSAFADFRKTWQAFDTDGVVAGGIPVHTRINPDPIGATVGMSYSF